MITRCIAIFLLACTLVFAATPEDSVPRRAHRPAWMKQGVVMAGNWEPLTFIRRRGGNPLADEENWHKERTEAAARALAQAGVTLVITNLQKGMGLETEASDMEATRQFTRFAHQHGIKVGGYIGATLFYETLFSEEPGSSDWKQINEQGQAMYYGYSGGQTFRYTACRNNPGYHQFLEKVMRLGVADMCLDMIHFDQMEGWAEPDSCRCRHCTEQFRQYLRARYTDPELDRRFGFHRLDGIIPPPFGTTRAPILLTELTNPLMQDWAHFRSYSYALRYAQYDRFLESINPEAALEGNPNLDLSVNRGFLQGVDIPQLLTHGDVVWSEEPNHAEWTDDGRLISKIRSFKAARLMGKSLFVYTGGRYGSQSPASPPELRLAEAMAYNGNNLGMVGDVAPDGIHLTPAARKYIQFFKAHSADLEETRPVADAAVLHAFSSTEFNPAVSLPNTVLFEQTLIQTRIPFDIIFDQQLSNLSRYKVLVLAGQEALSDAQVATIRRYVEQGGGLVITGPAATMDEARRRRPASALADLLTEGRHTLGKGRVVYIPEIQAQVPAPPARMTYHYSNAHWKLPRNYTALADAVRWAAAAPLSSAVEAPLSVTAELTHQPATGNLLLHLVNFDFRRPATNITAQVQIPKGYRLKEVVSDSPDAGTRTPLDATVENGQVHFRIPNLAIYNLAVIRLEKK